MLTPTQLRDYEFSVGIWPNIVQEQDLFSDLGLILLPKSTNEFQGLSFNQVLTSSRHQNGRENGLPFCTFCPWPQNENSDTIFAFIISDSGDKNSVITITPKKKKKVKGENDLTLRTPLICNWLLPDN